MSDTPLVRLTNLRKGFSKGNEPISIFDGLNLAIPPGDFAAVMGPSGSGKTTLLNLIGGLDRADAGAIEVGGRAHRPAVRRRARRVARAPTSASCSSSTT